MLSQFFSLFMPVRVYDISSVVVACLCLRGREREKRAGKMRKKSQVFSPTKTTKKQKRKKKVEKYTRGTTNRREKKYE
jgi:hypothetical protein